MSEQMQRMTCAHELAHCILHSDYLSDNGCIVEMEIFNIVSMTEYEANLFAANLLLDEDECIELLKEGRDMVNVASTLEVNVNLLALKLAEMKENGLPIEISYTPNSEFLGKIDDRADSF